VSEERALRLGHLYPRLMNVYGDRGNIICLQRRCRLRGITLDVSDLHTGQHLGSDEFDILFMGGAQDHEQQAVSADLVALKAPACR
jgi:CobQ-like glutamine amidotransferase family enzyme